MSGVDGSVLQADIVRKYTYFVWSGFRQHAYAIGGVTRGAWYLLEDALWMTRLLNNHCSRSVNVIELRSW